MTSDECLDIAHRRLRETKLLLDNQYYDAACSRAYYATHIAVHGALIELGIDPPRTHDGLKHLFNLHLVKHNHITEQAASQFEMLQKNRNISDYIEDTIDEARANDSLHMSATLVGAIEKFIQQQKQGIEPGPGPV